MKKFLQLKTSFEIKSEASWQEYPSPQFKRDSYLTLCGEWKLFVEDKKHKRFLGEIIVPFPPETRISGINRTLKHNEKYIYIKDKLKSYELL